MSHDSIEALRQELEKTRAELHRSRERIAMMEQSRFWKLRNAWWALKDRFRPNRTPSGESTGPRSESLWRVPAASEWAPPGRHVAIDIVVLIELDTPGMRACLDSLIRASRTPYRLIIAEVAGGHYESFARAQGATHVVGSTAAAALEAAFAAGRSEHVVILDRPLETVEDWLERLVPYVAAGSGAKGVVPLSRGLPGLERSWVAARGAFPNAAEFAGFIAAEFRRVDVKMDEIPPGCLLVRRSELPRGTGETGGVATLGRRVRAAGGAIALAEDVALEDFEGTAASSRPQAVVGDGVLIGIAARLEAIASTRAAREAARRWEGKRVLFVLPVMDRGGGANVVLREARAMVRMGVDARVVNLKDFESAFRASYPDCEVPVAFVPAARIAELGMAFDAVVATANPSVSWLDPIAGRKNRPVLGYYIQDFEPHFYPPGSREHESALASYTRFPDLVRFAKTDWNARQVEERFNVPCAVVGPSYDTSVFSPRGVRPAPLPLRIAAMIRPSTPRRQPALTMRALQMVAQAHGADVEIVLFGVEREDRQFLALDQSFPFRIAGVLDSAGLVDLFNEVHVFADFSSYQAMGLTALEAMACGAAVVVPEAGGARSFATDGRNALIVETTSAERCASALSRLVLEKGLAAELGSRGLWDVARFTPDSAAARILDALFDHA